MFTGTCPVCGRNDQCQKASAIFAAGTSRAHGFTYDDGRRRRTSTVSQTALARQMSPPVIHPDTSLLTRGVVMLVFGLVLHGLGVAVLSSEGVVTSLFAPLWLSGWLLVPGVLATTFGSLRTAQVKADLPRRHAIWQVWNTISYCYRDDVAFVPGGPPFHPGRLPTFMSTTTGPFAEVKV